MFELLFLQAGATKQHATGTITIGAFRETFRASLEKWNVEDYRSSWTRSANLFATSGATRFVTSAGYHVDAYETWSCVRRGDDALFINVVFPPKHGRHLVELPESEAFEFDANQPGASVWRCAAQDILEFEARLYGAPT